MSGNSEVRGISSARVIGPEEQRQRQWTGGVTTELFIYPADSTYEARDFSCRVSTATVRSDGPFTKFPNYERILVLLAGGGMALQIDGRKEVLDKKYQQLHFHGELEVNAGLLSGEIHDFNVIFRPDAEAQVIVQEVSPQPAQCRLPGSHRGEGAKRFDLIYVLERSVRVEVNDTVQTLGPGSLLEVRSDGASAPAVQLQSVDGAASAVIASLIFDR